MNSSMVRIRNEDLEQLSRLAGKLGVSRGKCISMILKIIAQNPETGELLVSDEQMNENSLIEEMKKNRKLLYRIIRSLCPLTKEDADDPEFGISLDDIYTDMNRHPEKYGKENGKDDENNNHN